MGWAGLVMTIVPQRTACYRCAFPIDPEAAPSCAEAGIAGPVAGVIGSLQALEALKLLTGAQPPLELLGFGCREAVVQVGGQLSEFPSFHQATSSRSRRVTKGSGNCRNRS